MMDRPFFAWLPQFFSRACLPAGRFGRRDDLACFIFFRARMYISEIFGQSLALFVVIGLFAGILQADGLNDSDAKSRVKAAHTLAAQKDPEARKLITHRLQQEQDAKARAGMIDALQAVDGKNSMAAYKSALSDADPIVRAEAVQAIGAHAGKADATVLHSVLLNDTNAGVRMVAAFWLSGIKNPASVAVLEKAQKNDADANVRNAATQALKRFSALERKGKKK